MEVKIRIAEETDFAQIVELIKALAVFEKQPEEMVNSVDRMLAEKDFFHCFVAETNDKKIVGYASYFFCYYTFIGKSLYMDDLYVSSDCREKGVGTLLINKVIDYAKETSCHILSWQVSFWNKRAIDFYKNLGADIDSTQKQCDLVLD